MNNAQEVRPRELFCIIADSHARVDVARATCEGLFREAGETVTMSLPPDWAAPNLPADDEWRIAWHKFYFGLDLSHAFAVTGDPRFLDVWLQLVLSFIGQMAPNSETDCHVTSRRVLNWIYAWNRFASAKDFPGIGAPAAECIAGSIERQVRHIRGHLSPKLNHRTIELTAILHAVLAFPAFDPQQSLLNFAAEALHENLQQDILEDGVHRERSTHYHMISLRNFLGARINGQRFGAAFPDGFDQRLERACEFAMECHRPDGGIPAFSDSDTGSYLDLLALAADLFHRDDFRYAATRGQSGHPPRNGADFPQGGYFTQRGWDESKESFSAARYLLWDCGPPGEGGHGHYDALHFEMAARGKPLLIDPGRFTYSEATPNWRRWFKGTQAHNTVCVDGLDQTPYDSWGATPGLAGKARAQFLGRWSAAGLDIMRGMVSSNCYAAEHQRTILFIGGEYWLLEDCVTDRIPHSYDLRFHLTPDACGKTKISEAASHYIVESPGLTLFSSGGETIRLEDGWFAPLYGVKEPAPVLSIEKHADCARFVTLLFPTFGGKKVGAFTHQADGRSGEISKVEIEWSDGHAHFYDSITWSHTVTELVAGPHQVQAIAAWLRRDPDGLTHNFAAAAEGA